MSEAGVQDGGVPWEGTITNEVTKIVILTVSNIYPPKLMHCKFFAFLELTHNTKLEMFTDEKTSIFL